jgi:hypothetical protein
MDFGYSTPALLFSAISLVMLAFSNRFHALAALVRELHAKWKERGDSAIAAQIRNLRLRIKIIVLMQIMGVTSFLLCVVSMLLIFAGRIFPAEFVFAASLVFLLAALGLSIAELSISARALDILLDEHDGGRDGGPRGR